MSFLKKHWRTIASVVIGLFVAYVLIPVIGEWFITLAREKGLYASPSEQMGKVTSWFHPLANMADLPSVRLGTTLLVGIMIGVWLDTFVRRRERRIGEPMQNVAAPTLTVGLYVSDIRFNFTNLNERHGEWSMRVFNGTGRAVEFSGLTGRIKFNAPNNTDPSCKGELPEPSARADMAQTVGPFKEWLIILSQRVPAADADKLSTMLAADTRILFNLDDLTIKVCAQDARQKIERLPIWGGVSYNRGFGFGQIVRATGHMTLG